MDKNLKGNAGVYYVMAQLCMRGFVALPTTRNLKAFDIVAFKQDLSKNIYLQIKSTNKPKSGWPVLTTPKDANKDNWESLIREKINPDKRVIWIFVALPSNISALPDFYIVPSEKVAESIIKSFGKLVKSHPKINYSNQLLAWGYYGLDENGGEQYLNNWEIITGK